MIKLFRISASEHINDITGTGARIYGGRWNHTGYPVVYSSGSRSLAALEFLVHVPMALAPENLSIVEINIQENIERKSINESRLPSNWRDYPAPEQLANIGTNWIKSKSSLLLDIPSAVVEKEVNTLINPLHPDIKFVDLTNIENFSFDSRLFKQK
ncbi:MAG: RES family NAD+ phosphorylase [Deltaproteobacteria bacterium]|nr:RES family NAD+ phosphorylase [Deltaproteobacteria bacterium]